MSTDHDLHVDWDSMNDEALFAHAREHPEEMTKQQAYFHLVQRHEQYLFRYICRAFSDETKKTRLEHAEHIFHQAWSDLFNREHEEVDQGRATVRAKILGIIDVLMLRHLLKDVHPEMPTDINSPQSVPLQGGPLHAARRGRPIR
jgi:hypothetical protein